MSGFRSHLGRLNDEQISFSFNGQSLSARAGDTVASALLANGIEVVGRSFKYHRPRGVNSCGAEESGALVSIGIGAEQEPNVRATMQLVTEGMQVSSQNCWPSAQFDLLAINNFVGSLFPSSPLAAGFYYKTFMWPAKFWYKLYEPAIRRAAGMGKVPDQADTAAYDRINSFYDIAIIGGGAAGLSAALSAAQSGLRVVLMDEHASLGGQLLHLPKQQQDLEQWRQNTIASLIAADNVTILTNTVCWGRFDGNTLAAHEVVDGKVRHNFHKIHAEKIVIATGAIERPLVFTNNDKPGVMLASGARKLLNHYGVAAGREMVLFTNNDSAYKTAFDYHDQGLPVTAIIDSRESLSEHLFEACQQRAIPVYQNSVVTKAKGWHGVRSVQVAELKDDGTLGASHDITCDLVAHSGGWSPQVQMASHGGTPPIYDEQITAFVVDQQAADTWSVGAAQGEFGLQAGIKQAMVAAQAACQALACQGGEVVIPAEDINGELNIEPLWSVPAPSKQKNKQFVDIQHDVTTADIGLAHKEGFISVEHMKRYTTLGMANDQGRTANVNALAMMAGHLEQSITATGTTRFRPPIAPVSLGSIAGRETGEHVLPLRRTPMQEWHERQGAVFVEAGLFRRPQYYPMGNVGNETLDQAYVREAAHVRAKVGLCDVSSLGKIEIVGPDSAVFLDRIYVNLFSSLPVNKARYGIMLREDGHIYDDGTTSRLADDRYFMTTTTAKAGAVLSHLERCLEIDWPELQVRVSSVSEHWAAMAVAGPQSRATLQLAFPEMDFNQAALPFMGLAHGEYQGCPLRILRVSFSGELAYEVYVQADHGEQVWQHIMAMGQSYDIIPYGLEALGTLRIEKGHVTGAELDGRVTLADVNMQRMASKKKWFVGQNLMQREGLQDPKRPCLVGLKAVDPQQAIPTGAILVNENKLVTGCDKQGWVSSMTYSPALDGFIALGFLTAGQERIGETIYAAYPLQGQHIPVEVVSSHFYDPDNTRVKDQ